MVVDDDSAAADDDEDPLEEADSADSVEGHSDEAVLREVGNFSFSVT